MELTECIIELSSVTGTKVFITNLTYKQIEVLKLIERLSESVSDSDLTASFVAMTKDEFIKEYSECLYLELVKHRSLIF